MVHIKKQTCLHDIVEQVNLSLLNRSEYATRPQYFTATDDIAARWFGNDSLCAWTISRNSIWVLASQDELAHHARWPDLPRLSEMRCASKL